MVDIIPRRAWGARHAASYQDRDAPLPARRVWLHHSVTIAPDLVPPFDDDDAAVRTLERIGQQRFGWGISYTHVVTPAGRVYEGHRIDGLGAHTGGDNTQSRAICLIGDYTIAAPTPAQTAAVVGLLRHGHTAGWWTRPALAGGHRDAPGATTACPGAAAWACIADINRRAQLTPSPSPRTVEDDLTPEQAAQLARIDRALQFGEVGVRTPGDIALAVSIAASAREEVAALRAELAARPAGVSVEEVRALLRAALADVGPLYLTSDPA